MRILLVTTWFPTAKNLGAGSFIARDAMALAKDHEVTVLHLAPRELYDGVTTSVHGGVNVQRLPIDVRTPRGTLAGSSAVRRMSRDVDVIHTMAAPALLALVPRRPSTPWVHTEHWTGVGNLLSSPKARMARPLVRRAFGGPDRVVAVSEYLADQVRRLRSGPVEVVGNIVEEQDPAVLGELRERGTSRLRLLGVGGVIERKGWALAVDALSVLISDGIDAELTWLGAGPELDLLRERAALLPVKAPGHVSAAVVRHEMASADVFVLPTSLETFSLVTVEALTMGLPVVVTGTGPHTEFVQPGTGIVVDRTAEAIAAGVRSVSRADRRVVAAHGRRLADRFSEERFREQYSTMYREVSRQ